MIPVPTAAHHFANFLSRGPHLRSLARRIGEREGWGSIPHLWTSLQRGIAREEIRARLDVTCSQWIPAPAAPHVEGNP